MSDTRTQQRPPQTIEGDTMERLFQALFYRIAVIYARAIPKNIRRLGETTILVMVFTGDLIYLKNPFFDILGNYLFEFTYLSSCCIQSETSDMSFSCT